MKVCPPPPLSLFVCVYYQSICLFKQIYLDHQYMIASWFHLGDPPGYAESIAYKSPNQTSCYQWRWPLSLLLLTSRMHQYSVAQSFVRPTFLVTDMQRTLRAIPRYITHARLRTRTSQHKKWAQLFLKTDLFVGGKQTSKPSTHHKGPSPRRTLAAQARS